MAARVLIVEDERELNYMIRDFLTARGFVAESVFDGATAVRRVFEQTPDIVLLDLNLPGLGGLDVARTVTTQTDVPIIITTARSEEDDRLAGFLSGADDYLVKPFSLSELALRINAVLRRVSRSDGASPGRRGQKVLCAGPLRVDADRREVYVDERRVELTTVQFAILHRLAGSPGRVFSRLQLLESFQDHAYDGYERTIDVHIKNIRKRIEPDPAGPVMLTTVRGAGYRLEDRPNRVSKPDPPAHPDSASGASSAGASGGSSPGSEP